jgi:hypothetical protein
MQTLTIHAETPTELRAVKTVLKAMKIKFEEDTADAEKSPYNPEFVAMIKQGKKDIKAGKGTAYSMEEFQKLCK